MKDTTLLKLGAWLMALLVFAIAGVVALILLPYLLAIAGLALYIAGFPSYYIDAMLIILVYVPAFVLACLLARMSYKWIIRRTEPRWARNRWKS